MTNVDTVSTYFASHSVGGGNIVTTGALNSGSITSGFGAIDIGSDNLTATGTISLGATSFNDNAITNVGDIALDSISADGTDINIAVSDNSATALTIKQGSDAYLIIDTANSSESVAIGTGISGTAISIGHSTSEVTVNDNLTVTGDLTVSGTTTTVNSTTVNLNDHNIVLDSGNSTSAVINGAGITLEGGSGDDATFLYSTTGPKFELKLGSSYEDLKVDQLIAASLDISGNIDIDGTSNLDAVDIDGVVQVDGATTFGVDDTGVDVKFFGATSGAYLLWDESADKLLTAGGAVVDIVKDKLLIGGTAVTTTAAELNVLDAVTAGTVTASLGVVVDSNKDIGTFRNITLSGELDAGSLDVSGDIDVDGTSNLDAVDIDGAVQIDATVTIGANDQGYDVIFYGDTASANVTWDTSADDLIFNGGAGLIVPDGQLTLGSTAVAATAAELNIMDGNTSATSTTLVNADRLVTNDNGTMKQVALTDVKTYLTSAGFSTDDPTAIAIALG
jgi:cytoskeletal protein CcmA (bactofilin family)